MGEAVRHSVYILNKLPTRALIGSTPYEIWKGKKPHIGHISVFSCISHMKMPIVHTKKLDDRSKAVVHLGKEPGTKAYMLFDPKSNTVCVSRDVVFEEEKSWSWNKGGETRYDQPENFVVVSIRSVEERGENIDGEPVTPRNENTKNTVGSGGIISHGTISPGSNVSESSNEPLRYKALSDIYDNTEVVELEEELMFMGVDEP